MTSARATARRLLRATAVLAILATTAGASPRAVAATTRARRCDPGWCAMTPPTAEERRALVAEADRLVARYADDTTALGRQCAALGATMKAHVTDVRMIAYMWRVPDPDGNLAPVTGDAHPVEEIAGSGHVHIARGFDERNPDRGLAAILQTARHEFAHLNGSPRSEGWRVDAAEALATACGPE